MKRFWMASLWIIPLICGSASTCLAQGRFQPFPQDEILQPLSLNGWASPSINRWETIPAVQARPIQISAMDAAQGNGSFSNAVQYALDNGDDFGFNGPLCTKLGLTTEDRPCLVKAVIIKENGLRRQFMVSIDPGFRYVLFGYKRIDTEGTLFLTSAKGKLSRCVHVNKFAPMQDIPVSEALPDFEKEKAFWIERLK